MNENYLDKDTYTLKSPYTRNTFDLTLIFQEVDLVATERSRGVARLHCCAAAPQVVEETAEAIHGPAVLPMLHSAPGCQSGQGDQKLAAEEEGLVLVLVVRAIAVADSAPQDEATAPPGEGLGIPVAEPVSAVAAAATHGFVRAGVDYSRIAGRLPWHIASLAAAGTGQS